MTVMRRSTMTPIREPELMTPEQLKDLRALKTRRHQAMEEVANRRNESLYDAPEKQHDDAVKHYEAKFPDLNSPALALIAVEERAKRIEQAARKGEVIDWEQLYDDVGETIRKNIGLPSGRAQEHQAAIDEAKAARGQTEQS